MAGAGWWATVAHLPALAANPRVELVAVTDTDGSRAERAAEAFGASRATNDLEDVLGDVEAVVVATPHTTHHAVASAALRAGAHVLVEKPLTTTADDAWDLVSLANAHGLVLAGGSTYQYADTVPQIRSAVQTQIGRLVAVNGEFSSGAGSLYAITDAEDAHLDDPGVPHGTTYSDPAQSGGGQGQAQLSHVLAAILFLAGCQATEVAAFMADHGLPVDVVDALTFRLEDGALGAVTSAGTTPSGVPGRHQIRFHGTGGMVEYDMLGADAWVFTAGGGARHLAHDVSSPSYPREGPVNGFVATVLDGAPNRAPGDLAAAAVSLTDAAYRSARTGAVVPVQKGTVRPPS
jgi:predicted dehydrogenase